MKTKKTPEQIRQEKKEALLKSLAPRPMYIYSKPGAK